MASGGGDEGQHSGGDQGTGGDGVALGPDGAPMYMAEA